MKMKLTDAITTFLTSMIGIRSPNTILWYKQRLPDLVSYLGDKAIKLITIHDLRQWRADLFSRQTRYINHPYHVIKPGGLSVYTIHQYIRSSKRLFKWLHQEGLLDHNPAARLELPKLPKQKPRGIDPDLLKALINAVNNRPRDLAIIYLLADTGCRIGGLCGLRIKHLDLDNCSAVVTEKGEITRPVFYLECTAELIRSWLAIRPSCETDYLFIGYRKPHNPLMPSGVYDMLKITSYKLGIRSGFNPHNFRHAAIRGWLNSGMPLPDASRLAGHASVAITGDIYGFVSDTQLKQDHHLHSWLNKLIS
jgi:integrase